MIITNVNEGAKARVGLSGTTIKIGGQVSIDLAAKQKDIQHVVDVCLDNRLETMREGMGAWYVATIIVPARQYEFVPDGEDEDEEMQYKRVERALDLSSVELRLWALPEGYGQTKEVLNDYELNEGGIQ